MRTLLQVLQASALLSLSAIESRAEVIFREDFKEREAHIPVVAKDLTSPFLTLARLGPGADKLKLSHHPEVANDPHYVWNGDCPGPVLIAFPFREPLDLSKAKSWCTVRTKNVGQSTLHLAVRSEGRWLVQEPAIENRDDWNTQSLSFSEGTWRTLDPAKVAFGGQVPKPDLSVVEALGFAAPKKPNRSADCIRLDWFELTTVDPRTSTTEELPDGGFLENETPFLMSALVFPEGKKENRTRRGVIVPLGHHYWACFDTDLLRWSAVWQAPAGAPPLSYDAMASISFPDARAKAERPPSLKGTILDQTPKLPGAFAGGSSDRDPRKTFLVGSKDPVGPLPRKAGRWHGLSLRGSTPVLHYEIAGTLASEAIKATHSGEVVRLLEVGPSAKALSVRLGSREKFSQGPGASISGRLLQLAPAQDTRVIAISSGELNSVPAFPKDLPSTPPFPDSLTARNSPATAQGPFTIRTLTFPRSDRPIRATDLAFLSDGTAMLVTFDGDVWRIQDIEGEISTWTRVATGLFEPLGIETNGEDQIYVLGRDQITQLIDRNKDGHIDLFRNASNIFQQTLHTRDYATSLALEPDGSFLIAKGGINNMGTKHNNELSAHRGTILRISPDGDSAQVLADGLRMPYVGRRADGAVFASDQQGHHIPSTPIHLIGPDQPYLGFAQTKFRKDAPLTEPLLWFPYQANRSGAAFALASPKAFPDLGNAFLQVSWNGRLFAIETPEVGQPFAWRLPLQLDFPSLNGATHPKSGRLYLIGLGISGYKPSTPEAVGLASVHQSSPLPTPASLEITTDSISLTFHRPLTPEETALPSLPALRLFDIKRSAKYGSGHFRWDGKPGEHSLQPSSFALSPDRRTLNLQVPRLFRSDILDLEITLTSNGASWPIHLYSRPSHLPTATPRDLRALAKTETPVDLVTGDPAVGKRLFTQFACLGCHSLTGENLVGPSLKGLALRANRDFMRESILDPTAVITEGYEPSMPSFEGVIPPQDLAHLLSYLETLR